jgi:hypothetical protein
MPFLPRRTAACAAALALAASTAAGALVPAAASAAPSAPGFGPAIDRYAPYQGQTHCTSEEQPGVVRFRDLVRATYPGVNAGGILRGCEVGGRSEHKEGRAWDWTARADVPAQAEQVSDLLSWLLATDEFGHPHAMARRLGVMYVIWDGRWWASWDAAKGWQPYTGSSPHTDHVHVSFSWDGALERTSWWNGGVPSTGPVPTPSPTASPTPSSSATPRATASPSPTPTRSSSPSRTPSPTPSATRTTNAAPVRTATPTASPSAAAAALLAPPARDVDHSCPSDVPAAGFLDIATSVHRDAVDCAVWWGVAKGVTATAFQPDRGLDRAQAASFLARLLTASGGRLPANAPDAFDDDRGSVHEASINALARAGVLLGTGPRRFDPSAPVTRGQLASYVVRAWAHRTGRALPPGLDWFDDDRGSVHETAIRQAARAGVMTGTAPRTFRPSATSTRAQVASTLTRVLDLLVEAGESPTPSA